MEEIKELESIINKPVSEWDKFDVFELMDNYLEHFQKLEVTTYIYEHSTGELKDLYEGILIKSLKGMSEIQLGKILKDYFEEGHSIEDTISKLKSIGTKNSMSFILTLLINLLYEELNLEYNETEIKKNLNEVISIVISLSSKEHDELISIISELVDLIYDIREGYWKKFEVDIIGEHVELDNVVTKLNDSFERIFTEHNFDIKDEEENDGK